MADQFKIRANKNARLHYPPVAIATSSRNESVAKRNREFRSFLEAMDPQIFRRR